VDESVLSVSRSAVGVASDAGDAVEDTASDDTASDETTTDGGQPEGDDPETDDAATTEDDATEDDADQELVIDTAQPGTWPVGDAGTVTFDVVNDDLTLEGYEPADGWDATVDEDDGDEIEVHFTQDGLRWEFEVEIDDDQLEIELRQDHVDATAGSYDLPDGGSFAFDANGVLSLTDVTPGEGWTIVEQEEESDEFEIDLRDGDRTVEVEVELDDGRIEVEIDYEVVGSLPD
jgi:hypothetical protein